MEKRILTYEREKDCNEWNHQISRTVNRYNKALNEDDIEQKEREGLYILELIVEQRDNGYETNVTLSNETIDFVQRMNDILDRKNKNTLVNSEYWNRELKRALEQRDIEKIVGLTDMGYRQKFTKNSDIITQYGEIIGKISNFFRRQIEIEAER